MMRKLFLASVALAFVFVSCEKTALPDVAASSSDTEKASAVAASAASLNWATSPALFVNTDCTTSPLTTGCGSYNGGIVARNGGTYAALMSIEVRRCDGLAFSKKASVVELHADSVCGKLVNRSSITANAKVGYATLNVQDVYNTKYYSVVILPNGKKAYANAITVVRQ